MGEYKKITNNTNNKNETKFKFLINNIKNIKFWGGGCEKKRGWGCEKRLEGVRRRGWGAGAWLPALTVAPAAGAPPIVPDPWALPKAPASGCYLLCHVSRAQWRRLSGERFAIKKQTLPGINCKRASFWKIICKSSPFCCFCQQKVYICSLYFIPLVGSQSN